MAYKINHADILDWAKNYDGEPFDGILCDPPYELGFMGKSWDSTGIAFNVELWTELLRICKPGAHLLAFSGSRTYHRMACAIEDAGFEIRDMIEWVYGSGFPKSLNVGKAIEGKLELGSSNTQHIRKLKGIVTEQNNAWDELNYKNGKRNKVYKQFKTEVEYQNQISKDWSGYGTALKPAHEPCVLARKPIKGTVANNCLEHGTGGLNIDGSRVGKQKGDRTDYGVNGIQRKTGNVWGKQSGKIVFDGTQGRFPANLIHDGSDEVLEVFPESNSGKGKATTYEKHGGQWGKGMQIRNADFGDSGSAARFFYTAKASKSERNAGLEGFEEKKQSELSPQKKTLTRVRDDGSIGENPYLGTTADRKNHHPTVKPLSLTKYLANLIKPPKGGRLLVPFSGSGSEMIGALQAGWEYVEGVELTEEYIPIAEARIKYWLDKIDKQMEML